MSLSRESLLDLIEETYGTRHPDFESIREQYELIIEKSNDEDIQKDARLLIAGLDATQNTYEDWEDLDDYEKDRALGAVEKVKSLTVSILNKYGIEVG